VCAASAATVTWFVTRELAARQAGPLRSLAEQGHEIALAATPLALAADAGDGERERARRAWRAALAAIEDATGVAVRGVAVPWPAPATAWWRDWLADAGLDYVVSPARTGGTGHAVRTLRGERTVGAAIVAAWNFVRERPRLVGLPRATFAAHYDREPDGPELIATLRAGPATIARALGLEPRPRPHRDAHAPPPAVARAAAPRLAIVVPLKDEESGIASLAAELDEVARSLADVAACEFVFVDDGSTDRTWALLQERLGARAKAHLVRHPHNQGVAAAIRSGMLATEAPIVASIDGDLSYDPAEIERMLPLLADADVVTASPYHAAGGVKNVPGWRLVLSRTLSWCYRRLLRSDVRTWTSCFRLYRRAAVVSLPLDNPGFLGTAELLVRVLRAGGRVREHPCVLEARLFGSSKMKVLRTIRGHLHLLWQVARGRVG
jgi:dolichol-phosphate mannosyltransferase